jgi:hypothetical protein
VVVLCAGGHSDCLATTVVVPTRDVLEYDGIHGFLSFVGARDNPQAAGDRMVRSEVNHEVILAPTEVPKDRGFRQCRWFQDGSPPMTSTKTV